MAQQPKLRHTPCNQQPYEQPYEQPTKVIQPDNSFYIAEREEDTLEETFQLNKFEESLNVVSLNI